MRLLLLITSFILLSCQSTKESTTTQKMIKEEPIISVKKDQPYNVMVSVRTHIPYCGGAYPSETQLNNFSRGVDKYLLINNKDTSMVESNEEGIIYLNLTPGIYSIRELYKNMSLKAFRAANQPKDNQTLRETNTDCYKKWWSENLLKFEVEETEKISKHEVTIKQVCFTGKNPCVMYNGHLPK